MSLLIKKKRCSIFKDDGTSGRQLTSDQSGGQKTSMYYIYRFFCTFSIVFLNLKKKGYRAQGPV